MMKKSGFTLGEILIALTVIGVVAALILPQLLAGQKAAQARAQFDTAYSLLAKSIADMDADNVSVDPASYNTRQTLYPVLKQYHRVVIDCGDADSASSNTSVCIGKNTSNTYYIYNRNSNTNVKSDRFDDGAFVINNGMLFAIENPTDGYKWVSIDINGKNKLPNRWGWDLFTFELVKGDILPLGAPGTSSDYSDDPAKYCDASGTDTENGATCGYYAATNQDYFKELYNGH